MAQELKRLLSDADLRREIGIRGNQLLLDSQGAVKKDLCSWKKVSQCKAELAKKHPKIPRAKEGLQHELGQSSIFARKNFYMD